MQQLINTALILVIVFGSGVTLGSYLEFRYYVKKKNELLNDVYWLGDKDGDNPDIEYE